MFRCTWRSLQRGGARAVTANDVKAAYRLLGVQPGASASDVRKKFLALARVNHPDVNGGDDSKMKAFNTAYELVQGNGHLLDAEVQKNGAEHTAKPSQAAHEPNEFKRMWARPQHATGDNAAWNQRSEFDWAAAVGVTTEERMDERNHPNTFNALFSFTDDSTLYEQIKGGATTAQAARTLGKTVAQVERRLNAPQYRMRIQRMLRKDGTAQRQHRGALGATRRTVTRQPAHTAAPDAADARASPDPWRRVNNAGRPDAARSYDHLRRFTAKRRSPAMHDYFARRHTVAATRLALSELCCVRSTTSAW